MFAYRAEALDNMALGLAPAMLAHRRNPLLPDPFAVRALLGSDHGSGALALGGAVRCGQRLRFMVRDPQVAAASMAGEGVNLQRRQLEVGGL